jgi:hypothetical protein
MKVGDERDVTIKVKVISTAENGRIGMAVPMASAPAQYEITDESVPVPTPEPDPVPSGGAS